MEKIECIICGEMSNPSDEHIIPKSLGNNVLRTNKVCKKCNENLGRYVDEHITNNFLSQMIRQIKGLKGQSGKVPNPFQYGKEKDGGIVYVDSNFKAHRPVKLDYDEKYINVSGSNRDEIFKAVQKKLKRLGKSEEEIKKILDNADIKSRKYKPNLRYNIYIDFSKIELAFIKIAYEYMCMYYWKVFKTDEKKDEMRKILLEASKGKFNLKYKEIYKDIPDEEYFTIKIANDLFECSHILYLKRSQDNKLYLFISLFSENVYTYAICVSDNANKYDIYERRGIILEVGTDRNISIPI